MSTITAEMTVAEVLERHPETLEVFKRHGFGKLANPFLRRTFAHLVTVDQACRRHGVPVGTFLEEINTALSSAWPEPPGGAVSAPSAGPCSASSAGPPSATSAGPVHALMNVGEAVSRFPEVRPVFVRHFGGGCFTCPSFGMEDIRLACDMHGTNLDVFLGDCNAAVSSVRNPDLAGMTINALLRRYPETAPVLHRFSLDACCGGAKTLGEAASAHGVDPDALLEALRAVLPKTELDAGSGARR